MASTITLDAEGSRSEDAADAENVVTQLGDTVPDDPRLPEEVDAAADEDDDVEAAEVALVAAAAVEANKSLRAASTLVRALTSCVAISLASSVAGSRAVAARADRSLGPARSLVSTETALPG